MDGTAKVIVLGMLAAMLASCATLETLAPALAPPPPASLPPGAPLEAQLRQRLVGRWDGRVDLTFSDATLMIDGVRLERGVWAVDAAYGTTNLFLSAVPATLELSGADIVVTFRTDLGTVRLRLEADDDLRGTLTLATDATPRAPCGACTPTTACAASSGCRSRAATGASSCGARSPRRRGR